MGNIVSAGGKPGGGGGGFGYWTNGGAGGGTFGIAGGGMFGIKAAGGSGGPCEYDCVGDLNASPDAARVASPVDRPTRRRPVRQGGTSVPGLSRLLSERKLVGGATISVGAV